MNSYMFIKTWTLSAISMLCSVSLPILHCSHIIFLFRFEMLSSPSWFVYTTIFLVAVVQVPIAIDLLRFFFPHWKISRAAGNVVHYILFVCVGMIFCIGISYHIFVYLPVTVPDPLHSFTGWLHLMFALWVWLNMVGNYYHVVCIHPGRKEEYKKLKSSSTKDTSLQVLRESSDCNENRAPTEPTNGLDWHPKDIHYCTICDFAVPLIDHHCPFTGCCAGLHNYSHFFIGLLYGSIGLLYAIILTVPYFFECNVKIILWYFRLVQDRNPDAICEELDIHSQIFIPVFSGYLVTTSLLILQTIFLLSDLSTYNVLTHWSKYPMVKFMWHRIRGRKFLDADSRLKVLILNQRPSAWWYLLPVSNYIKNKIKHK